MTRNLWSWDQRRDWDHQRAKERAADKVLLRQRIELLDQAEQQRKDWRYGLFGEPVKGPPLEPEFRCEGATCECPWCESA